MKHRVPKKTSNSKGQVFYGTHMYPGLAEYHPRPDVSYRILVEEETIRNMDPTFAGRPVYVMHVDSVDKDVDRVRKDADGWVVESFYNEADGQHWAKFIVVTNRGLNAIRKGYKLSNCYTNTKMSEGGVYNGVSYDYKLKGAEYEHLAIVPDPRYDSKIMTPEEFKAYNEGKVLELKKVANSTSNKGKTMSGSALKFFKRESVKNSKHEELASLSVLLPKSNKEFTIQQCVEAADKVESARGKPRVANSQDLIRIENEEITVDDAVEELLTLRNRLAELEDDSFQNEDDSDDEDEEELDDIENEDDSEDEDPDEVENSASSYRRSDKTQTQRRQGASGKTSNRDQKRQTKRHKNDRDDFRQESRTGKSQNHRDRSDDDQEQSEGRERARRLRHANQQDRIEDEGYTIDTADRQVARGKELFGR